MTPTDTLGHPLDTHQTPWRHSQDTQQTPLRNPKNTPQNLGPRYPRDTPSDIQTMSDTYRKPEKLPTNWLTACVTTMYVGDTIAYKTIVGHENISIACIDYQDEQ